MNDSYFIALSTGEYSTMDRKDSSRRSQVLPSVQCDESLTVQGNASARRYSGRDGTMAVQGGVR